MHVLWYPCQASHDSSREGLKSIAFEVGLPVLYIMRERRDVFTLAGLFHPAHATGAYTNIEKIITTCKRGTCHAGAL